MKRRLLKLFVVLFGLAAIVVLSAAVIDRIQYSEFDKKYYLTERQIAFVRPGLRLEITAVDVAADGTVSATFTVADDRGLPLDREGITTPGVISASFILARIPAGQTQYVAYTTRTQTSPITNRSAVQASADSGGRFEKVAEGTYKYIFGTKLPSGFDANATHSVGVYATRDLTEFGLAREVANAVVNFRPAGGPAEEVRDVVRTEACNQCHDPLQAHGGARRNVELCVLCHTPQTVDPDTGESMDFPVLVHKIHRGEELPSVQAGRPYVVIGFRQRVFDFSHVAFPQDVRNCETCHSPAASQHNAYLLRPNRAACGACHDDVNFATGENHVNLPQPSDRFCASCHFPEGELEFDASVRGAHTIPAKSRQLEGLQIILERVMNTGPGSRPMVHFRLQNKQGQPISPSDLPFFNLVLAGPTTDYKTLISEGASQDSVPRGDGYSYTFKQALPPDAEGTFVVGAEAYRNVILNPGTTKEFTFRETAENPLLYFAVTDAAPVRRRAVVSDEKCEVCHENLNMHGTIRHDPEYCVVCHQPAAQDERRRPADQLPSETIDFKFLIHRIHRGEELTRDFTVYGFGNRPHNYNELLYPGDLRNCTKCHVGNSYEVPSRGLLPTVALREFYSPIPPNSAACLACHDTLDAAAHTFVNTAPFGESCGACHGSQANFAVAKVHARP